MPYTAHDAYLESRIESAGPVQLIRLLHQGAVAAVRDARRHLAAGDIAARSRAISKTFDILTELVTSLDRQRGGEIAAQLEQLYDYMQRRLIQANAGQTDEPLAEVLSLLATLSEAWEGVEAQQKSAAMPVAAGPAAGPWAAVAAESGSAAGHAWSF